MMRLPGVSLIQLHAAVFLFGVSGVFGKLINLNPESISWVRISIAGLSLLPLLFIKKQSLKLHSLKDILLVALQGLLIALHYFAYFKSVQVSTVAIAVISFATFPIFVTFLEPVFFKEKLRAVDIICALLVFLAISQMVSSVSLENGILQGVIWGLVAAFTCAANVMVDRELIKNYSGLVIIMYQCIVTALLMLPFAFINYKLIISISSTELLYLFALGFFCTACAGYLFIQSLKGLPVFLASLSANLEPIYGIFVAFVFLGEVPSIRVCVFGSLIILIILCSTIIHKQKA